MRFCTKPAELTMLSRVSLIVSLLVFCAALGQRTLKQSHLRKQSKIQEWRNAQNWKIPGIIHRLQTHLALDAVPRLGKIELRPAKPFQVEFKITEAFRSTLEEIQLELDSQSLLRISWKSVEIPAPELPQSPLSKSGFTEVETRILNSHFGGGHAVHLTTLVKMPKDNDLK